MYLDELSRGTARRVPPIAGRGTKDRRIAFTVAIKISDERLIFRNSELDDRYSAGAAETIPGAVRWTINYKVRFAVAVEIGGPGNVACLAPVNVDLSIVDAREIPP